MTEATEQTPITQEHAGAPETPPMNAPEPTADNTPQFNIPEEYRKAETEDGKTVNAWTDKVKSVDDLWKTAANAQKMLGKKHLTPDFANSTPNEIEQYFNQIRPADKGEYKFAFSEDYKETGLEPVFADMFHKAGLSTYQAEILTKQYQAMEQQRAQEMYDADSFVKSLEEKFGNGYQAKYEQTRQFIAGNLTPDQQARLETVPNDSLMLFYEMAANLQDAYDAKETGAAASGGNGTMSPQNKDAIREKLSNEMQELRRRPHSQEEYTTLLNQYNATFK